MNFTNVCKACGKLFEACKHDHICTHCDSLGYRLDHFGNLNKPEDPETTITRERIGPAPKSTHLCNHCGNPKEPHQLRTIINNIAVFKACTNCVHGKNKHTLNLNYQ